MDNETFNEIYTKIMIISNLIKFYRLQKPHLKFNEVLIKLIYKVNSTDNARWLIEPIMAFSATNVKPDLNLASIRSGLALKAGCKSRDVAPTGPRP